MVARTPELSTRFHSAIVVRRNKTMLRELSLLEQTVQANARSASATVGKVSKSGSMPVS